MANSYKDSIDKAEQDIEVIIGKVRDLETQISTSLGNIADSIKKTQSVSNPKEVADNIDKQTQAVNRLNVSFKTQDAYVDSLISLNKQKDKQAKESLATANKESALNERLNKQRLDANKERLREADLIKRNKDALAKQKKEMTEMNRAYVQLIAQQKKAKKILQDLIASEKANKTQIKVAQKEYDRLTGKIKQVDNATKQYNKRVISGAKAQSNLTVRVKSFFKTLVAFDLARRLVDAFWQSLKSGFETIKALDSIRLQFQYIIESAYEVDNTFRALSQTSKAYGANLLVITNRYIKFRAAAKQANLTARSTRKIFESVTKAAGVLGLKTDELKGIYLALEQMLSKGKVTTEELRRQLGERLPGAMGIMADAVGVSTEELDKMLKKGEILSADVLPKFAIALEKAYGIESVEKIDTVQAAQTRLTNAFIEFTRWLNQTLGLNTKFTKSLDWLADNIQNIIKFLIVLITTLVIYTTTIKAATIATNFFTRSSAMARLASIRFSKTIKALTSLLGVQGLVKTLGLAGAAMIALTGLVVAAGIAWVIYQAKIGTAIEQQKILTALKEKAAKSEEKVATALDKSIAKELEAIKARERKALVDKNSIEQAKIVKASLEEQLKVWRKAAISTKHRIKDLELEQREVSRHSKKYAAISVAIGIAGEQFEGFITTIKKLNKEIAGTEDIVEGSPDYYNLLISDAQKYLMTLTDNKEILEVQNQIKGWEKLRDALLNVKGELDKMLDLPTEDIFGDLDGKAFDDFARNLSANDLEKVLTDYENVIGNISDTLLDFDLSDEDRKAAENMKKDFQYRLQIVRQYIADLKAEYDTLTDEVLEGAEELDDDIPKVGWLQRFLYGEDGDSVKLREELAMVFEAAGESVALFADIAAGFADRKIQGLEEEQEQLDENYERQKEIVEESIGDEEAKEERKKQLEKQHQIETEKINKKIAKEKTKQAKVDKAAALIQAQISIALGVLNALTLMPAYLVPVGIGLAIGVGAVQTAAILAQPIPTYAEGTDDHKGGLAILGDGGKAEAGILPDGRVFKSKSKDTLYNLPKGTSIHPDYNEFMSDTEKMKDMVYRASLVASISANPQKQFDEEFENRLRKGVIKGLKGIRIYNNNTGVGKEVREALSDFNWEKDFL